MYSPESCWVQQHIFYHCADICHTHNKCVLSAILILMRSILLWWMAFYLMWCILNASMSIAMNLYWDFNSIDVYVCAWHSQNFVRSMKWEALISSMIRRNIKNNNNNKKLWNNSWIHKSIQYFGRFGFSYDNNVKWCQFHCTLSIINWSR